MNDGEEPQRRSNIWRYALEVLFFAAFVALIVYACAGNFTQADRWTTSTIDQRLGYAVTGTDANGDGVLKLGEYQENWSKEPKNKIKTYTEAKGNRSVTVTGTYVNENNSTRSFQVIIDDDSWNNAFSYVIEDSNGNYVTVEHASYSSIFQYNLSLTKGTSNVKDAFAVSFWDQWGPTIISTVAFLLIALLIFSRLNTSINGANRQAMDFNKSPAKRENQTKVKFSDVAGCDAEKAEMVELVEYLKDPKKYSKFGARLPKGVLLIGPPGTGKTLLAKAVAGEADVPFYSISGSDFVEMFVGVGAGRVRDLFRKAKQTAPCLIFIDEIDAVGRQRGAGLGGGNDEREQTLNQLLVEMDGFEPNSGILVIAATNRDDVLDPALRRAGRFDRTITVSLPDRAGREAIFKVHARNKKVSPEVDYAALAKRTVGFSGADIDNIMNEAALLAVRRNGDSISMADIDEAIDRRISGPAKNGKGMSEAERREVAYHEAGHAVIGLNLPHSEKVQKITIVPRGNTGGHVLMTPEDDRFLETKSELEAMITGLLGGRTSEEIFFQDVSTGASNDIQEATRIARSMVTEYGMSDLGPIQYEQNTGSVFLGRDYTNTARNFSTQVAYEIDQAVRKIVDDAHSQAYDLLMEHKGQVIMIAETLLEKETITAEEIDCLTKNGHLAGQESRTYVSSVTGEIVSADGKIIGKKDLKELKAEEAKPAEEKPEEAKPESSKPEEPKKE